MTKTNEPWYRAEWIGSLLIVMATLLAYQRALHAGFIWDDDAHVTRPGLQGLHGLGRIWADPRATQQYYPVLYSAFWLEHVAWGGRAAGYHLANILLHALAACLLFRLLLRLGVPGALVAAGIFALHPVNVESVAWVSEQKNTLSAAFCLGAALAYLRFDRVRRLSWYAAGTALFFLALLSKSVTATLPAALLVILWWKRGRITPRGDILPLLPWLALGGAAGFLTAWLERTHVGASGAAFALSGGQRLVIAGHALWFYFGKVLWPAHLVFIYPRWTVVPANPARYYLYPASAIAVLAALWLLRGRSRAPLAVGLLFAGTLFPALGFVNVFPFLYSFVADHFQYLAMAALVSGLAGLAALAVDRLSVPRAVAGVLAAGLLAFLGILTDRQCSEYHDVEALWRATIAGNPACWMAYNNLASELLRQGRVDEGAAAARSALQINPADAAAHATLGEALGQQGRLGEAVSELARAIEIEPDNAAAHIDLGADLLNAGRTDDAAAQYREALGVVPDSSKAHAGLGDALLQGRQPDAAINEYMSAIDDDPANASAEANLGTALMQKGRAGDALAHYQAAVSLDPLLVAAQVNLANALLQAGRRDEALGHYRRALELDPGNQAARSNLDYALSHPK
jgi:tetratricopeptide (TPR) repeat protein